jgi:putative peptide zinc metalloprotease protein
MSLKPNAILSLVPIEIRKDKKRFIIEDQSSGEFFEMPEICIDAITLIRNGEQLGEIESTLKNKYPDQDVDLLDFAEQLLFLELVDSIDGVKVDRLEKAKEKEQLGFLWIAPKIGKAFFNNHTYPIYISLFIINIVLFLLHPSLFPRHDDIFVFDIMVVNVLFWMVFTFLFVLIHEFGHVLAMRAHNLPTKLEIGHRLFFVVLLTDMSSVWKLTPKDRNVLFLAGLCFDTVLLFISLIFQLIVPVDQWLLNGLMNLAVFDIVLRMLFQCCIYMKTDLYFVFENVSGCYNLMENAKQTIRQKFSFLNSKASEEVVFSGEKKTVFIYSLFYFLGVILTVVLYFMYYIPEVIYAAKKLLPGFVQPPTSLPFWDAVVFSLQVSIFIILLLYSWRKKYLLNKM